MAPAPTIDMEFLRSIASQVDQQLRALRASFPEFIDSSVEHRPLMAAALTFTAGYFSDSSSYFRDDSLQMPLRACLDRLQAMQGPGGLFDGVNLCSPPDTAFTINDACQAYELLRSEESGTFSAIRDQLKSIIDAATPGLVQGGVHTPNHRWELSAALARINSISPAPRILERIDEWLAEGIDQLPDGQYSERSPLYAKAVTNPSLLAIARHANKPELLDVVRRNLRSFLPFFSPEGTVESLHSRRQDQWQPFDGSGFAIHYRRFAVMEGEPEFSFLARQLGALPMEEPSKVLAEVMLEPALAGQLPESAAQGPHDQRQKSVLGSCGLHQIHTENTYTTVYGGGDHQGAVASGLSNNPTFLKFRQGRATLADVRLSRSFFDLGPFRAQRMEERDGTLVLSEEVEANFYLPLPPERIRSGGDYELEGEGRFTAAMGFGDRQTVRHYLKTEVTVSTIAGGCALDIEFAGTDTAFALELAFAEGGILTGVEALAQPGTFHLVQGTGEYRVGDDVILFGPGHPASAATPPGYNPGEAYKYVGGSNAATGQRVYVTGRTVGRWTFHIKGRPRPS